MEGKSLAAKKDYFSRQDFLEEQDLQNKRESVELACTVGGCIL